MFYQISRPKEGLIKTETLMYSFRCPCRHSKWNILRKIRIQRSYGEPISWSKENMTKKVCHRSDRIRISQVNNMAYFLTLSPVLLKIDLSNLITVFITGMIEKDRKSYYFRVRCFSLSYNKLSRKKLKYENILHSIQLFSTNYFLSKSNTNCWPTKKCCCNIE